MTTPRAGDTPSLGEKPSTSLHEHDPHHGEVSTPRLRLGEKGILGRKPKHHDPNWTGEDVDFSMVNEKATLRKMDIRLIPMLAVLYLLSFLDRGNIGNAKIQGLTADLELKGDQYNLCLTGMLQPVSSRNPTNTKKCSSSLTAPLKSHRICC